MLIDVAFGKQQRSREFSSALPFCQQLKREPLGGRDLQHKISPLTHPNRVHLSFDRISWTAVATHLCQLCRGPLVASRFAERRLAREERFEFDHQRTSHRVAPNDFAQTLRGAFVRTMLKHSPYCVADRM